MIRATDAGTVVVELAPFRLKPGVDEATLLERSEQLQDEFLRHQRGFLRRELLKGADGEWMDVVHWEDEEAANAIMSVIAESPACRAYFEIMIGADMADPAGGVSHFRRIRTYEQ